MSSPVEPRAPLPTDVDERAKAFQMAQAEMDYRVDLYTRLTGVCFDKCMDHKYKDGDLNVGENSCVDRCAAKYWQCVGIVGQLLGGQQ
mmetsp:Transcript_29807/g.41190  ORF Transcript_29807/g.41190 Transcript_29807/m.41190 type:complete len:88 (-) Transcript_29807:267-530(-)|eukprot:CAMPEP_0196580124 /NCGR_PEP_ID=MMETSP1081-20130531/27255_1 /TAXON_ID=36882 /ORGANISM="Pyramimonas amylifera, Strain CCMP720" /LENGTH=87 /DNA_ID=CAMNT_0041899917 /DNA_START=83 /DNA_END=346 /DNA_ORIENTATION=-